MKDLYPRTDFITEPVYYQDILEGFANTLIEIKLNCQDVIANPLVGSDFEEGYAQGQDDLATKILQAITKHNNKH